MDYTRIINQLAMFGGRSSIAANAADLDGHFKSALERAGVPYTLMFHPRPGWQFVVEPPEKREP